MESDARGSDGGAAVRVGQGYDPSTVSREASESSSACRGPHFADCIRNHELTFANSDGLSFDENGFGDEAVDALADVHDRRDAAVAELDRSNAKP